jgi:hypothetical protein
MVLVSRGNLAFKVDLCVNGEMISVETIPGMGGGGMKGNGGEGEFKYDIFDIL